MIFSHSKIKFLFRYVLKLFINLSVVAAMLRVMVKLSTILKSDCVNTLEFLLLLEREWKRIKNYTIEEQYLFCNHWSGFDNFSLLASNNNYFKGILKDQQIFEEWGIYLYHMIAIDLSDFSPLMPRVMVSIALSNEWYFIQKILNS